MRIILGLLLFFAVSYADTIDEGVSAYENQQYKKAFELLEPSQGSNSTAQYYLALMHFKGLGILANPQKGFELMQQSANIGNKYGLDGMGFIYEYGNEEINIAIDYATSFMWYHRAIKAGNIESKCNIVVSLIEKNKNDIKKSGSAEMYAHLLVKEARGKISYPKCEEVWTKYNLSQYE